MHDIKWIREHPEAFDAGMKRRNIKLNSARILELDAERRKQQTEVQELQSKRNALAKEIGAIKKSGGDADAQMAESKSINEQIKELETLLDGTDPLRLMLDSLPNIMADDVPDGDDEADNRIERVEGSLPEFQFEPKDHVALGEALGQMDFEAAAKMSGSRFVVLSAGIARLERALAQFMLDLHTKEHGYTEVSPPLMVRDNALYGTGQLPKFAEDSFRTTTDHWLIPTAEVSLTNIVSDSIIDADYLPRRFTAFTPCFRSEAGSAGKDTRGMIRQHQFYKVELVSVVKPEDAETEHDRLLGCAEEVLKRLGLHYRVVTLCTGDTGFGAQKTYDLEVWMPGQDTFREISSCSRFGDFQARRMKARFRKAGEKETTFVHTLNGSGLAVGRTLIAVLENYQNADGSITVPDVLRPYMGCDVIEAGA